MRKLFRLLWALPILFLFASSAFAQCPSQTPNVQFQVPNIGNTTTWGLCLNGDLTTLDNLLGGSAPLATGSATVAINQHTNWVTANTGPITITSIVNGYNGQTIQIFCGTGDTFTSIASSGTISLSSTWSCATSKSITLTLISSVWQELGRQGVLTPVTGTSPIVVTGTVISCPTCNTSTATIGGSIASTQIGFGGGSNAISGNAGFTFVTPNMTIPTGGAYQINGLSALFTGPSANANLSVGSVPFPALTSGTFNTVVGDQTALAAVTSGTLNVAVGATDMGLTTTGQQNTALGTSAMQSEGPSASFNTAVGAGALKIVTSNSNTAVGQGALEFLISGNQSVAVGAGAGANTTGSGNTLIGFSAGVNLTTGSNNVIIGNANGSVVTTGSGNVVIGVGLVGPGATSNELDVMDAIIGTGMNVPSTSTVEYKGNLQVDGTCTGCGSGTVSGQALDSIPVASTSTALTSTVCTPPTTNGTYSIDYVVTGGVAVAPTCPQIGLTASTINGAASTYTVLYSDAAAGLIVHDIAGSSAVTVTLPTPTTLGNAHPTFVYANHSSQTDTITPTTWTIQKGNTAAGASITVAAGTQVRISVDPFNATNWIADANSSGGSTPAFPITITGGVSGAVPCFTSTTVESAGTLLAANAIVQGGGAGACPTTGNADFSLDATAHTFKAGAAGLVDLSAQTGANSFRLPTSSGCTPTTNGAVCFNTNNYVVWEAANQLAIPLVEASTLSAGTIPKASITGYPIQIASSISDNGTTVTTTEPLSAKSYQTATNCAANGTAANPSVASCTSAAAGMFSCSTSASTGTCQVNTTAVTANSEITITQDAADGGAGQLNVTCNTGNVLSATAPILASKSPGASFTINLGTVTTNPACFEYTIKN
jgi:hypothetical protein